MQAMKGATMALGSMNRSMNLPQLQRIAMEFERENDIMEQRQEMMDDAVDDAMDVGIEEEGDEVVEQVLEEIGIDLNQAVRLHSYPISGPMRNMTDRWNNSLGRLQPPWATLPCPKARLRKPLGPEAVAVTRSMMTFRPDSTAFESKRLLLLLYDESANEIMNEKPRGSLPAEPTRLR